MAIEKRFQKKKKKHKHKKARNKVVVKKNKSARSQCNIIKQTMSNQWRKVQFQAKAKISRKEIKVPGTDEAKGLKEKKKLAQGQDNLRNCQSRERSMSGRQEMDRKNIYQLSMK